MAKESRVKKISIEAKLRDVDFGSMSPAEVIQECGFIDITLRAVTDGAFLEELVALVDRHTDVKDPPRP